MQNAEEFVLTKNGNLDFGEITQEIASAIKRQAAKIKNRSFGFAKRAAVKDRNGRRPFFAQARSPFKRILLGYLFKNIAHFAKKSSGARIFLPTML